MIETGIERRGPPSDGIDVSRSQSQRQAGLGGLHDYDGRNPYYEPFIEVATHIQFSAEATANPQSLMSRFIAQGKAVALCTDGKRGASLMTADGVQLQQQLSPGLHVVDSD